MDLKRKTERYAELYTLDASTNEDSDAGMKSSVAVWPQSGSRKGQQSSHKHQHLDWDPAMSAEQPLGPYGTECAPASSLSDTNHRSGRTAGCFEDKAAKAKAQSSGAKVEGRILDGFRIFFFPADERNPARKIRIRKAVDHGAIWISGTWTEEATHIVVDRSMCWQQVIKHANISKVPEHIIVVNEDYLAACIGYQAVVDPRQNQYLVKGHVARADNQAAAILSQAKTSSLPPKQQRHSKLTCDLRTSSQNMEKSGLLGQSAGQGRPEHLAHTGELVGPGAGDTLNQVINEAKKQSEMLLDEEDPVGLPATSDDVTNIGNDADHAENPIWQKNFQCMTSHTGQERNGPNAATIAVLHEMATHYDQIKDAWRPIAYRKAIASLIRQPHKICTREEAEKLPAVGARIAAKIEEIVYTGYLCRLEAAKQEPTDQILQLFLGVYGIGFAQSMRFIAQGYSTLQDLRTRARLSEAQRIGIARFDDFNARIPRAEVAAHADVVTEACREIDAQLQLFIMGSYRRGAEQSGDIDMIVTHPTWSTARLRSMLRDALIPSLVRRDFLKCTLADTSRIDGTRWHGAACLPGSDVWRRCDFLLVPAAELGAALIYFTGNDIFNRSMRLLAGRKGMRLNQRGLFRHVMRGRAGVKVTEGELVEAADERKIFQALGVPWREPWERVC